MSVLLAGLASLVFIFLKAFQQRNVVLDAPAFVVMGTSLAMAFAEVYVIAVVVRVGYDPILVCSIGLGAGIGCVLAMRLHRVLFRKREVE